MKKLIMTLFAVAITIANITAQESKTPPPNKTPEERAENITSRMTKNLNLNAEQQQKVKELILKTEKERKEVEDKVRENRKKMEVQMDIEMQKILNAEQFDKYKKKKEEMKEKRMERKQVSGKEEKPAPQNLEK
jgi:Spy/CpxP family protein refolding chaperone